MARATSLREALAAGATRTVNALSRVSGRGAGTVIGGRVGLALAPTLLEGLARGREVVVVSGTNGKTTTTALLAAGWGGDVVTNATGANMPEGHVAALSRSRAHRVVLEVDESWLARVVAAVAPQVVVLLNLSRDQLDRGSEVRAIATRWREALGALNESTVVANANDPLVVYGAELSPHVQWCDVPTPWTLDARSCPHCTRPIVFTEGSWACSCGFRRPATMTTTLDDELLVAGRRYPFDLAMPGAFNRANAALALTALGALGVSCDEALGPLSALANVAGRFSRRRWRERELRLLLAKNPAGFAAMFDSLEGDELWIAINARVADGHDPSWLYDVPFERLRGRRVVCWGDRCLDLATRLDYAGVAAELADEHALGNASGPVDVLANYTAFHEWWERSTSW